MNTRFLPEINSINQTIVAFNQYLNPTYKIPVFDSGRMIEEKNCIQIVHGHWDDFGFPNSTKRGVYFIFGHEKVIETKNGLYIGKASFSSAIGSRLDHHLRPCKNSDCFEMNGYRNEKYILDYMASIDLDSLKLTFLAPALEEYLITELKRSLNLINGTGN
jgi:hypothetical protein